MDDPLWKCMSSDKSLTRSQLELVIQKKKVNEIFTWFQEHFEKSSHSEYIARCPIVIIQGPTGCGKTSTLKWLSNELKIQIKDYSETTDTTALNYDLAQVFRDNDDRGSNLLHTIDRRKAIKFEHFVINNLRFSTLYPAHELPNDDADSEFDNDDDFVQFPPISSNKPPQVSGVIIHVDTPLAFAKSQKILIGTLCRLIKVIREISIHSLRRVAIVFETLEGEQETISLPMKIKQSLNIQVFKFNPIIRLNMKKLIESLVKQLRDTDIDKDTIEFIINDCDGDIRSCLNLLQLICSNSSHGIQNGVNNNSLDRRFGNGLSLSNLPVNKKLKLNHAKKHHIRLNPSLMRDSHKSLGFFHFLGKILYQKRLYPIESLRAKPYRSIDRPFPPENSTEYIVSRTITEPKNLICWLHQHYYKFCGDSNIAKASLFLENLSAVDVTSLGSTMSSQFYEMSGSLDQIQNHLAVETAVYSLYQDQSASIKPSYKKISTKEGQKIIKGSTEKLPSTGNPTGDPFGFTKPQAVSLTKLVEDHRILLDYCTSGLNTVKLDPVKALLDYIPYLNHFSRNKLHHPVFENPHIRQLTDVLGTIEVDHDFDVRHEKLLELIEEVDDGDKREIQDDSNHSEES